MSLSLLQYNILSYLLLLPVFINLFNRQNTTASFIFGGVFMIFQFIIVGQHLAPNRSLPRQFGYGLIFFVLCLLIISTIIYYLWDLSIPAQAIVFLLIPVAVTILQKYSPQSLQKQLDFFQISWSQYKLEWKTLVLLIMYLSLMLTLVWEMISSITTTPILSPWDVLPESFWLIYFFSTLLFLLILKSKSLPKLSYALSVIHIFLSVSIAIIIYQLGYGFDPFIHQAAEKAIATEGVILPKTLYYIGQYSLTVSLHHLLGLSVVLIDKFLLPTLVAVTLPLLWLDFLPNSKNGLGLINNKATLAITLLLIPFTSFIVTTPQGLANLFFIWIVLTSFILLSQETHIWTLPLVWFINLACLFTHPLTGIPAFILTSLVTYELVRDKLHYPQWAHKILYFEFLILGSISLSLLFLIHGLISPQFSTQLKSIKDISLAGLGTWWPLKIFLSDTQYRNTFYEFAYFIQENIWWMLSLVVIIVMFWLYSREKNKFLRVYGLATLIFFLNAIIISTFLEFPEIIQYESQNYAGRLFDLAFWTLLPFLGLAAIWAFKKRSSKLITFQWVLLIFVSWVVTGNVFASYPRNNRYELGHQYNVSASDVKTVQKIGAHKTNYVVLANQSVSAAAIREYGFKTYYDTEDGQKLFYYPVPTSSPLYDVYLSMVYDKPTRANAQKASDLTGVNNVYFVLNNYWDNSELLLEQAKLEADEWIQIDNGATTIFTYKFATMPTENGI